MHHLESVRNAGAAGAGPPASQRWPEWASDWRRWPRAVTWRIGDREVRAMTTDLREHLQTTLGDAYSLGRELGGGGMARVFVAEETALGRTVIVKVLPP